MAMQLPNHMEISPGVLEHLASSATSTSTATATACNNDTYTMMMSRVKDLAGELTKECAELELHLFHLHNSLSNLIILWISHSIAAKTAIHNLHFSTSSPGRIQQMMMQDLPHLAVELKQIENIRSYLNTALQLEAMIGDLEDAAFSVMSHRTGNDHEPSQHNLFQAIRFMNKIEDLLVNPLQFKSQWHHLINAVDSRVDKTVALLRPHVIASHRALLASLGWPPKLLSSKIESGNISALPNPLVLMQSNKQKAHSESFLALCALQHLKTRRDERQLSLSRLEKNQNAGLWAIDELAYPISSRVEFHFSKWTDQPEFIFTLVYKITKDFMVGVDDVLQPLIDKAKLVGFSAKEAWVSAMVQMLSTFLGKQIFSNLSERYNDRETRAEVILSWLHLVDLMVKFDRQLLSLVSSDAYLFKGLSVFSAFHDRPDWLKLWAKVELKDSKMKLKEEMNNDNAWLTNTKQRVSSAEDKNIDNFVSYRKEDCNAPLITEPALKLAWEMAERCKTLPDIFMRVKFIRSTSAKFIWYFMNLLIARRRRIDFSAANFEDDTLVKRCGLINAAKYCEFKLQEWSDEIYFLEMGIAERESQEFIQDDVDDNYHFFGEEIKSFADLELNWLMEIITAVLNQFESLAFDYVHNKAHFEREEENYLLLSASEVTSISVSNDFVEALDTLRSRLCLIEASINPKDFSDLWRNVADALDRFIFGSIFTRGYGFSGKGAKQFEADVQALFLIFSPFCARPEAFFPCTRDALRLLSLDGEKI